MLRGKRRTPEEFKQEVYNLVGNEYTFLGKFKNMSTKMMVRHNSELCNNYEYMITPTRFINEGNRCRMCYLKTRSNMKTNKEFLQEVYSQVGNEYTFLEDYKGSNVRIKVRHNSEFCNDREYLVAPSKFINGRSRCRKCTRSLNNKEFLQRVYEKFGNKYTFLEEYKGYTVKIRVRHNSEFCNNREYMVAPGNFLDSSFGCLECYYKSSGRKSNSEFLQEVYNQVGDEYTFLEEYKGSDIRIKVRHNNELCGNHEYEVIPSNFISAGTRCPYCARHGRSRNEMIISNILDEMDIRFSIEKTFKELTSGKNGIYRFDFHLKELNTIIEYDGEQHFQEISFSKDMMGKSLNKLHLSDIDKNRFIMDNVGLNLVRIPYTQGYIMSDRMTELITEIVNGELSNIDELISKYNVLIIKDGIIYNENRYYEEARTNLNQLSSLLVI